MADSPTPSDIARALQSLRKSRKGAATVLRPCPKCGQVLSARETRKHKCGDPSSADATHSAKPS